MFQVEERGFYVKVVSNKEEKAAISLYKALESLTNFNVQSSNLATVSDTYVLTFTLTVSSDHSYNSMIVHPFFIICLIIHSIIHILRF